MFALCLHLRGVPNDLLWVNRDWIRGRLPDGRRLQRIARAAAGHLYRRLP